MSGAALDPRRNAVRPDLADAALEGRVPAEQFVEGTARAVTAAVSDMRKGPGGGEPLETQALYGETVIVFEEKDGWAWGQLRRDGYVGYLPAATLGAPVSDATHRVAVTRTFLFPRADVKAPPRMTLPLNAALAGKEEGGFIRLDADAGFVFARHATLSANAAPDFVTVAEGFLGTPYLWGGRTAAGIDCSGLVQVALQAAGFSCPRDSDMQRDEVGDALPVDTADLRRGDLICWQGHIGMMCDGSTLLHANAHHMMTAREALASAVNRIAASGLDVLAVKRLASLTGASV